MIRWWLLLAAAGVAVSACTPARALLARPPSRPVAAATGPGIQAVAPGGRGIPALEGKTGSVILPRVTYPDLGINVLARPPAAPGKLAADAVSPAAVLAAFKAQPDASLVRPALRTERPAVMLRTITELHPTARGAASRPLSGLGGHLPPCAARVLRAGFILEECPGHVRGHHGRRDGPVDSLLQSRP
jgi:hypothetical protein